jgi:hypothetical protein
MLLCCEIVLVCLFCGLLSSRRSFTYIFNAIGKVEGGGIKENRLILTPGSQVLLCSVNLFKELEVGYIYVAFPALFPSDEGAEDSHKHYVVLSTDLNQILLRWAILAWEVEARASPAQAKLRVAGHAPLRILWRKEAPDMPEVLEGDG